MLVSSSTWLHFVGSMRLTQYSYISFTSKESSVCVDVERKSVEFSVCKGCVDFSFCVSFGGCFSVLFVSSLKLIFGKRNYFLNRPVISSLVSLISTVGGVCGVCVLSVVQFLYVVYVGFWWYQRWSDTLSYRSNLPAISITFYFWCHWWSHPPEETQFYVLSIMFPSSHLMIWRILD